MDLENSEFNEEDFYVIVVKNEQEDVNKSVKESKSEDKEHIVSDSQQEFQLSGEESETVVKKTKNSKFLKCNSYVEKLRKTHPEYKNDESKLIEKLLEEMKNAKPEEPPENFIKNQESLDCSICGFQSKTLVEAKRHYTFIHGPRYLVCFACGHDFRCQSILQKHEIRCKAPDIEVVLKARAIAVGRRGSNRPFLDSAQHIIQLHKKQRKRRNQKRYYPKHTFDCAECPARFKAKRTLIAHMNLHQGLRPHRCNICAAAYTSLVCLRRHMKKHEPEKHERFMCDTCGRVFQFKDSLAFHMNVHLPQKKFACTVPGCEMRYSEKRALTVHVDVKHRNLPKPFPCTLCIKRFNTAAHLKVHMKLKHGMEIMTRKMFFKSLPHMTDPNLIKANAAFYSNKQVLVLAPDCQIQEVEIEHNNTKKTKIV